VDQPAKDIDTLDTCGLIGDRLDRSRDADR
jgi:hypothetical protein